MLQQQNLKVFYDQTEQAYLWGKDLNQGLGEIYSKEAKYCVMIISQNYARKWWTAQEKIAALARAFEENREYILPVRLDDTEIPGLMSSVVYMDLRMIPVEKLVNLTIQKLRNG